MYDYQADIRNPLRTHTVILYRYLLPIAILVNNAFKTVQQSAKDKEDICKRADRTAKISDARCHTLMGQIKMHYFRGLL